MSVDPVIIVKLMLLLFLDDVRSERELIRIVPLRLDYLWFLGYGLEDEVPNHSVLSKAIREARESIRRSALLINRKRTATSAQREERFFGITSFPVAVITSIAPSEEPAQSLGFGNSPRGIRADAL